MQGQIKTLKTKIRKSLFKWLNPKLLQLLSNFYLINEEDGIINVEDLMLNVEDSVQNLQKQYDLLATPDNKEKSSFAQ